MSYDHISISQLYILNAINRLIKLNQNWYNRIAFRINYSSVTCNLKFESGLSMVTSSTTITYTKQTGRVRHGNFWSAYVRCNVTWAEANVWNWTPVITIVCFYRCTSTGSARTEITSVSHGSSTVCSSLPAAWIIEDICDTVQRGDTSYACAIVHVYIDVVGKMHEGWSAGYLAAEFRVHWHFRARAIDPAFTRQHMCNARPCVWNYFNGIKVSVLKFHLIIGEILQRLMR